MNKNLNPLLNEIREYRRERLTMKNPKGWEHIRRVFTRAALDGWFNGASPADILQATIVLERLAHVERLTVNR